MSEQWFQEFQMFEKMANDGDQLIPVVQGLVLMHEDANGQFWMIMRDEQEKPICAVKMSRKRFAWFHKNMSHMIETDFLRFGDALNVIDTIIEKCYNE